MYLCNFFKEITKKVWNFSNNTHSFHTRCLRWSRFHRHCKWSNKNSTMQWWNFYPHQFILYLKSPMLPWLCPGNSITSSFLPFPRLKRQPSWITLSFLLETGLTENLFASHPSKGLGRISSWAILAAVEYLDPLTNTLYSLACTKIPSVQANYNQNRTYKRYNIDTLDDRLLKSSCLR